MRRVLLRSVGVAVCTWFQFAAFPGHTFLEGGTQLTVPMLERLANPGFLSRDLLATHADLAYTGYDEVTLFFSQAAGVTVERVLDGEQVAARAAGVLGVVLLALSVGLDEWMALFVAAVANLGGFLAGPHLGITEQEATPRAIAWGALLLAMGLLARVKPLLAGLFAGIALLYDPVLSAPFCILLLIMFVLDSRLRRMLRPSITIVCVFILLLANLAQLQPGMVESEPIFSRLSQPLAAIQQFRTPHHWVGLWPRDQIWSYLAIWICGIWGGARVWPLLNRQVRWMLLALPACGIFGVSASYILLDRLHWAWTPHLQPAQCLLFTIFLSALLCVVAAIKSAQSGRIIEAALWFVVPCTIPLRTEILSLHKPAAWFVGVLIAAVCGALVKVAVNTRYRLVALAIPVALGAVALALAPKPASAKAKDVRQLSDWARQGTWGSSMFFFPDLGSSSEPGLFRARADRAVWVDWKSGELVPLFPSLALAWWDRWQRTMQPGYTPERLQSLLVLPIDYYVLSEAHKLAGIKPVFRNGKFVVYDANDLRNATSPLRTAGS